MYGAQPHRGEYSPSVENVCRETEPHTYGHTYEIRFVLVGLLAPRHSQLSLSKKSLVHIMAANICIGLVRMLRKVRTRIGLLSLPTSRRLRHLFPGIFGAHHLSRKGKLPMRSVMHRTAAIRMCKACACSVSTAHVSLTVGYSEGRGLQVQ